MREARCTVSASKNSDGLSQPFALHQVSAASAFSSPIAVAASTLAAAALFSPVRARVQRLVDRRFNRVRYDADATVAAFSARLREAVDLDAVRTDLLDVVGRAVEPAHASIWINHGSAS